MYRVITFSGLLGLVVFLIAGCANGETRLGWVGSDSLGQSSYRFDQFTGDEVYIVDLEPNQTIQLSYDIAVEKGLICLEIVDPQNKVLWEKEIVEPESDAVEITCSEAGWNYIVIQGDDAEGMFEVEWQTK